MPHRERDRRVRRRFPLQLASPRLVARKPAPDQPQTEDTATRLHPCASVRPGSSPTSTECCTRGTPQSDRASAPTLPADPSESQYKDGRDNDSQKARPWICGSAELFPDERTCISARRSKPAERAARLRWPRDSPHSTTTIAARGAERDCP